MLRLNMGWRKAGRDLWLNKTRTILVVLAIAIGIFAIGSVLSAYSILTREMDRNYLGTNPASAIFLVDDATSNMSDLPEVAQVEARRQVNGRIQVAPNEWLSIVLFVIEDFNNLRINTFTSERGVSEPAEGQILIERSALELIKRDVGEVVLIKAPNGQPQPLTITGVVHDPGQAPAWMEGFPYGYMTPSTLAQLGEQPMLNELRVVMAETPYDQQSNRVAADKIRQWLETNGTVVKQVLVPEPGKHPHNDQMQTLLFLLEAFALLALILSGVLVTTVISALMGQQLRQIGVMKAMGATTRQIAAIYYSMVIILGLLALLIGLPAGVSAGRAYAQFAAWMLNFKIGSSTIDEWVYLIQLFSALFIPLLSAAYPIYKGSRLTVHEALNDDGVNGNAFGTRPLDSLLGRIQGIRRTLLFSLRNTFRQPRRMILTVLTLAAGGGVFMTAINIGDSWQQTIDGAIETRRYDILFRFTEPYAVNRLEDAIRSVPSVSEIELWGESDATLVHQDGTNGETFQLLAPPASTTMIDYPLIEGRWLQPSEQNALVLNHNLVYREPSLAVGREIVLQLNGEPTTWQIVGIVREIGAPTTAYTNYDDFSALMEREGYAEQARIAITSDQNQDQVAAQTAIRQEIEQALQANELNVAASQSVSMQYQSLLDHVVIIVNFLILMALLVASVGGLGLMSTMSLNVLERRREIGVMRAMGATRATVLQIILTEGLFIGSVSWLLAMLLSVPLTYQVGNVAGQLFIKSPLTIAYSALAYALWLLITLILAAIASVLPARRATEVPVSQALAYN